MILKMTRRAAALAPVMALGIHAIGCGGTDDLPAGPSTTRPAIITETRADVVQAHALACVEYTMSSAGLVSVTVSPTLFLTLRAGTCAAIGDFQSNSDVGNITIPVTAGRNVVVVGNPRDEAVSYSITITHPR
jgi:hypothetical protein